MESWICTVCGMGMTAAAEVCSCGARPTPTLQRLDVQLQTLRWEIGALQSDIQRLTSELRELESQDPTLIAEIDAVASRSRGTGG